MIISDHLGTDVCLFRFVSLRCFAELCSCALLKFFWGDLTIFFEKKLFSVHICNLFADHDSLEDKS